MLDFVAPEGFDLFQMILQKSMIVVGGLGSIVGLRARRGAAGRPARGAARVQGTQEIVFGALLVGFVLFMPRGLVDFLKRRLPGWEEPLLHGRRPRFRRGRQGP